MYYLFAIPLICPILVLLLAPMTYAKRPNRIDAVIASLAIGLAFALVCHEITYSDLETDAVRIMRECAATEGMALLDVLADPPSGSSSLVVLNVWEWVVGQTGDPRLFQASAAFLGYSTIAWLLFDCRATRKCSIGEFMVMLLFVLVAVPMQTIVGNVRSTLVCIIAALALYIQSEREKPFASAVLLIVSCGIHVLGVVGLLLWVFRKPIVAHPWKACIVFFAGIILVSAFSLLISTYFSSVTFINDFFQKLLLYREGTDYDQINAGRFTTQLTHGLSLLLLCLMIVRLKVAKRDSPLVAYCRVSVACTFAMELLLVNVGIRLMYLPMILYCCASLCRDESTDESRHWHLLVMLDLLILVISLGLSAFSWMYFLMTFNWQDVLLSAVFFPAVLSM